MDTKGHRKIAIEGQQVLRKAFHDRCASDLPRLGALLLGNWLMDVSQSIDPVAMAAFQSNAKKQIRTWVPELKRALTSAVFSVEALVTCGVQPLLRKATALWGFEVDRPLTPADVAAQVIDQVGGALCVAVDRFCQDDWNKAMRATFKVLGYFEFCHPVEAVGAPGEKGGRTVDFRAYEHVFDHLFRQYYPHLHLDRPEILAESRPGHPVYETEIDSALRMHRYMKDHIVIAAGELALIDRDWARPIFRSTAPVNDACLDFNLFLARLGAALHLVEDFFSHSNFVEHATLSLGPEFLNWKALLADDRLRQHASEIVADADVALRRLLRQTRVGDESSPEWISPYLVTGFYDTKDMLTSLCHMAEEFLGEQDWLGSVGRVMQKFGFKWAGQAARHLPAAAGATPKDTIGREIRSLSDMLADPSAALEPCREFIRQTLELFNDPEYAMQYPGNKVAGKLKELGDKVKIIQGRPIDPAVSRLLLADLNLPESIQNSFVEMVETWTRVKTIGSVSISLFDALTTLCQFLKAPGATIRRLLLDAALGQISEELVEAAAAYTKRFFYNEFLGADRVGCHSLMAKDHGHEVMAEYATSCAKAVHQFVVEVLTRRARPVVVEATRALPAGGPTPQITTIDTRDWVDYEDLLFSMLRYPVTWDSEYKTITVTVRESHVCDGTESLGALVQRFRPSSADPDRFTLEALQAANPDVLCQAEPGLKPALGMVLIIPEQKRHLPQPDADKPNRAWWRPIFEQKDHRAFERRDNWFDSKSKRWVQVSYPIPWPTDRGEVDKLVARAAQLRKELEGKYKPRP